MMDPRAIHVVFDTEGLETHVMPVNVARSLDFDFAEVRARLHGRGPLPDFLVGRWESHVDGGGAPA
jgi:hypothetical protein